jgi:hypothetical protein
LRALVLQGLQNISAAISGQTPQAGKPDDRALRRPLSSLSNLAKSNNGQSKKDSGRIRKNNGQINLRSAYVL